MAHKRITWIWLFLVVSSGMIFCSQKKGTKQIPALKEFRESLSEKNKYQFDPAALFIFLDDTEAKLHQFGAISQCLSAAIMGENCPIITSQSLLYNICNYDYSSYDTDQRTYQDIFKTNFRRKNWVIKTYKQYALLVPRAYCVERLLQEQEVLSSISGNTTTAELKLGLKVNHLETKTDIDFNNFRGTGVYPDPNFVETLQYFFCERELYRGIEPIKIPGGMEKIKIPDWAIYISGHGQRNDAIANLSIRFGSNHFQQFMDYLQNKINTRLLIINSCYAGGDNLQEVRRDEHAKIKNYQFAIIVSNMSESLHVVPIVFEQMAPLGRDMISKDRDGTINFLDIMNRFLLVETRWPFQNVQVPQLKLPGTDWFDPINVKDIVSIGSILSKSRGADRPLDIVKFFNREPKVLILYDDIPFELIIRSKDFAKIITMRNSIAINKISAPGYTIDEILGWFEPLIFRGRISGFFPKYISIKNINDEFSDIIVSYSDNTTRFERTADKIKYFKFFGSDSKDIWQ